eukprot:333832-Hanusia_phi.AAC.1
MGAWQEEAKAEAEAKKGHEKVISSLPAGEGEIRKDTLLLYVQPESLCTVPFVREFFADRSLLVIRVIGSGFAAVTFSSGMECELARDEVDICFLLASSYNSLLPARH